MSTITLIHETDIDAPAHVAWQVVADYARDIEWRNGVARMTPTPDGPVQVGTTTAEEIKVAGKTYRNDGEVVTVEPGSRFAWRTTAGAAAHGSRKVTPIDPTRCRVQLELHVTPTGLDRLFAPVLEKVLAKGLAGDLQRLRNLVTAEATGDSVRPPRRGQRRAFDQPDDHTRTPLTSPTSQSVLASASEGASATERPVRDR